MNLVLGTTVIHPHHGPATITGHSTRLVGGQPTEYLELMVQDRPLTVSVPAARVQEIGIRDIAGASELDRLAAVLTAPSGELEPQWSRRFKEYREQVNTGDLMRIAAVVRDLLRRQERATISPGEHSLLKEAAEPLVAEVALAVDVTADAAREVIRALVLDESRAVLEQIDGQVAEPASFRRP